MLYFYLILAIGVSFLCSLFEAIILSASPAYVTALAESGKRSGRLLNDLKTRIDDSLAAILTLNTISHTIGASGVGAEVLKLYGDSYVAIASVVLTLLILVLSEIIPKTIGATYWRPLAPLAAEGIRVFIIITYPFVVVFQRLSHLIGHGSHESSVTRDEILFSAQIGRDEGTLSQDEAAIIKNLLRLQKILAREIMTPRTVVFALDQNRTVEEVILEIASCSFSRIPIFDGEIDRITGVVTRVELLAAHAAGQAAKRLIDFSRELHAIPETVSVASVFDTFVARGEHLFAVIDEHGGFDGVVSLEDVLETLLGVEITDEFDSVEDLRAHAAEHRRKGIKPKQRT